jgi:hypothetical protein
MEPDKIAAGLRAWTKDQDGHVRAAVELLIEQGKWLDHEDFATTAVSWYGAGSRAFACIDWRKAAQVAEDSGASGGELSALRFAIALGSNQFRLSTLDDRNARLYMTALATALGMEGMLR